MIKKPLFAVVAVMRMINREKREVNKQNAISRPSLPLPPAPPPPSPPSPPTIVVIAHRYIVVVFLLAFAVLFDVKLITILVDSRNTFGAKKVEKFHFKL